MPQSNRRGRLRRRQYLGCDAAIFFHGGRDQCVALESARVVTSVPDLGLARARKSSGAGDLSPGTSGKSWKGRDLLSDLTAAVASHPFPEAAGQFRRCFAQQKEEYRSAVGTTRHRDHKYLPQL